MTTRKPIAYKVVCPYCGAEITFTMDEACKGDELGRIVCGHCGGGVPVQYRSGMKNFICADVTPIYEGAQPTEPMKLQGEVKLDLYTVDEVANILCEFMDEPCDFYKLDKCCDDWCEEHCKKHTPLDCWKHALESGWLKGAENA